MRLKHLILAVALVAAPGLGLAHEDVKGPNGGQVIDDKGHHVEFTVKGNEVVLHLTDDKDKPIASKGATGRVVILDGSKQLTVALMAAEPNLLFAKLEAALGAGAKVVVSAKLSDGHNLQARFVAK
jgi:hypothetical protein